MLRKEYEEMDLENLITYLWDQGCNEITDEETIKSFIIEQVENDDWFLAKHLLDYIWEHGTDSEYYLYDYSMGTLDNPVSIDDKEDIKHLIDFED